MRVHENAACLSPGTQRSVSDALHRIGCTWARGGLWQRLVHCMVQAMSTCVCCTPSCYRLTCLSVPLIVVVSLSLLLTHHLSLSRRVGVGAAATAATAAHTRIVQGDGHTGGALHDDGL